MAEEVPRYWYEILDRFTRRDEQLAAVLRKLNKLLGQQPQIITEPGEPVVVEPPERPIEWPGKISIPQLRLVDHLLSRLPQLPNRLHKVDIDTSKNSWKSLKGDGKLKGDVMQGFIIEDIGGGFNYKVSRGTYESPSKTAELDDKWDIEFDDIAVYGLGTGTATIWYWWRETIPVRERVRERLNL